MLFGILFFTLLLTSSLNAQSKIVYLKSNSSLPDVVYVGQNIKVEYELLLLSDSVLESIAFADSASGAYDNSGSVVVRNPDSQWSFGEKGVMKNTFIFKIKGTNFKIPTLIATARSKNGSFVDESIVSFPSGRASSLSRNSAYSGVVADSLEIVNTKVDSYGASQNVVVFDLFAKNSNLEDFKLDGYEKQGFEERAFGTSQQSGIYFVVLPKDRSSISFEYFNLSKSAYDSVRISVELPQDGDNVDRKSVV